MSKPLRLIVLIGGQGTNLQALIDARAQYDFSFDIAAVLSHRPQAYGLVRAAQANLPIHVVDHQLYSERRDFEKALITAILPYQPDLIILAGFMRILSSYFIREFPNKIWNIHPALLPKFKGIHTHRAALAAGETVHGATVHVVTDALDSGPILAQIPVPIYSTDTEQTLGERVLVAEHQLYPQVIDWYAKERLCYVNEKFELDGQPIGEQGVLL